MASDNTLVSVLVLLDVSAAIETIDYNVLEHPSIHFLPLNPSVGSQVGWSLSQQSSGKRWGTPWTDCQSITGPHRDKRDKQPFTLS